MTKRAMRSASVKIDGIGSRTVMRVTELSELPSVWRPENRYLVSSGQDEVLSAVHRLVASGVTNLAMLVGSEGAYEACAGPRVLASADLLQTGDVIALSPGQSQAQVLFRATDEHHTVFLTNQCNSRCVMCSQPSTPHDDSWLVEEALKLSAHIVGKPRVIGFTGGEPLLLGAALRTILERFTADHPETAFDVLTNGRLLSRQDVAKSLLDGLRAPITWLVPLYGQADFLHDFVVQTPGAFEQTIDGLLALQTRRQPVQLRVVLIKPVLHNLVGLCEFIGRNLPFVREVALMGCEPTGFAMANRQHCEVDIGLWRTGLEGAVAALRRMRIPVLFMNLPLCSLPVSLRRYAAQSISDWKRVFVTECDDCAARDQCAGLFSWHERGWKPATIRRLEESAI